MSIAYKFETSTAASHGALSGKLAIAQQRIEQSFLEGGNVLIAVMDSVNGLTEILDGLVNLFDPQATRQVVAGMASVVGGLAGLPEAADRKQGAFHTISGLSNDVYKRVEDMREIIRYLRTIAVTVKITGASIPEFAGFADEIRERIQAVSEEIDRFGAQLVAMRDRLGRATKSSDGVIRDFAAAIPQLVANMDRGSVALADQQKRMTATANELKQITGSIQMKIATVLSALQIGDVTRQRIEHVMTMLKQFEAFKTSGDAAAIDGAELAELEKAIAGLARAQLVESVDEFHAKCASISGNIASFTADASQVMSLRDELAGTGYQAGGNILTQMQGDLAKAAELSLKVGERTRDLDTVVASVDESTQALITGIATIRKVKLDIFYMALNSNLACTRLGEAGRAVNVVSGELRIFADKLEVPAEGIVLQMQEIESAKALLDVDGAVSADDADNPLDTARFAVDKAADEMSAGLASLSREGEIVFGSIEKAIRSLDFRSDLGDVLDECLGIAAAGDIGIATPIAEGNVAIDQLSASIFKTYTMVQERDVHCRFLPVIPAAPATQTAAATEDDDLFGELF